MATAGKLKETMRLQKVGDRELWILDSEDKSWALPMFLDRLIELPTNAPHAMVYPALSPYPNQLTAIEGALLKYSILDSRERYLIAKDVADRRLRKAPGITPQHYYKWPDPHFSPIPMSSPMRIDKDLATEAGSWEFEQFLEYISSRYNLPPTMVRVSWKAIRDEAAVWMLESGKALDLGFVKLVALPFRANWKEIVRAKFRPWKLGAMLRLPHAQRMKALEDAELPQALCSPHNIGLNTKGSGSCGRLHFTIEAIPTEAFERAVNIVEGKRWTCGSLSYVAHYEQLIEKQYHYIVSILTNYVRKISAPFARLSEGSRTGVLRFLPTRRPEKLRGVDPRHIPVDIVAPDSPFSVLGEASAATRVHRKDEMLPSLSLVPSPTPDVREPAGESADGVPLLDAGQECTGGESVLPSPEARAGDAPGLAAGPEQREQIDEQSEHPDGARGSGAADDPAATAQGATQAGHGGGQALRADGPESDQGQVGHPEEGRGEPPAGGS